MGPHSWDPNAPKPDRTNPGAIPENKPEPELTPKQQKAHEAAEARGNKKKMICGTTMLGHAFQGAAAFDQPLGAWKVDQVTDIHTVCSWARIR